MFYNPIEGLQKSLQYTNKLFNDHNPIKNQCKWLLNHTTVAK